MARRCVEQNIHVIILHHPLCFFLSEGCTCSPCYNMEACGSYRVACLSLNCLASLGFARFRLASLGFAWLQVHRSSTPSMAWVVFLRASSSVFTDVLTVYVVLVGLPGWNSWMQMPEWSCDVATCWGFSRLAAIHRGTYMLLSSR